MLTLIGQEVTRILTRPRVFLVIIPFLLLGFGEALSLTPGLIELGAGSAYLLFNQIVSSFTPVFLFIGYLAGDTFVMDRKSEYITLILTRGLGKKRFIVLRIISSSIASVIIINFILVGLFLISMTFLPLRVLPAKDYVAFETELFNSAPFLQTIMILIVFSFMAAAFLSISFFASTYTKNPAFAIFMPIFIIFFFGILIPFKWQWLNPLERLTFAITHAKWVNFYSMVIYWLLFGLILFILATYKYAKDEDV